MGVRNVRARGGEIGASGALEDMLLSQRRFETVIPLLQLAGLVVALSAEVTWLLFAC